MMKNSIYLLAIMLWFSFSCTETNKKLQSEESVTRNTPVNDTIIPVECYFPDTNIYKETVVIWENSWRLKHPNYTVDSSPVLAFSIDSLIKLKKENAEADGVRMYYVIRDKLQRIPSLAMVNMTLCAVDKECEDACVLFSELGVGQTFITHSKFEGYKGLWQSQADSLAKVSGNIKVFAYNYSWSKIMAAAEARDDKGIWVTYGLRTLGPNDTHLFVKDPPKNITGGIAYCNIMWESNPQIHRQSKALGQLAGADQDEFDFAIPCPAFCN
jgi:hypothetical protein